MAKSSRLIRDLENYGIKANYKNGRRPLVTKLFLRSIDRRCKETTKTKAREELILISSRYIIFMLRKLVPDDFMHRDDLLQVGFLRLITFIDQRRNDPEHIAYVRKNKSFTLNYLFIQVLEDWKKYVFDQWTVGATELTRIYQLYATNRSIADFLESERTEGDYWLYCFNGMKKGYHIR